MKAQFGMGMRDDVEDRHGELGFRIMKAQFGMGMRDDVEDRHGELGFRIIFER